MQRKLNTRTEKINFLKDLQKGKVTISNMLPVMTETWICRDGVFEEMTTKEILNQSQYELKLNKQGFKEALVIRLGTTDKVCIIQKG